MAAVVFVRGPVGAFGPNIPYHELPALAAREFEPFLAADRKMKETPPIFPMPARPGAYRRQVKGMNKTITVINSSRPINMARINTHLA